MKACVYKSTGSWYIVKTEDGFFYNARAKGAIKMDSILSTNPIVVGDEVDIVIENSIENTATISHIAQRKNYIARTSPSNKRKHHILATNIDQNIILATLKSPTTSMGFIDRLLVVAEMYHIPSVIVFNKADVYKDKEMGLFEALQKIYDPLNYAIILSSFIAKKGWEHLQNILKNKTSLLSGHSGVGKSTLVQSIFPDLALKIQNVSSATGKGLHTTTFAQMYDLPFGGRIVDTPGIRELGIADITTQELGGYFVDIKPHIQKCQFNNCLHLEEPNCAVKNAVIKGLISHQRYSSYCSILATIQLDAQPMW